MSIARVSLLRCDPRQRRLKPSITMRSNQARKLCPRKGLEGSRTGPQTKKADVLPRSPSPFSRVRLWHTPGRSGRPSFTDARSHAATASGSEESSPAATKQPQNGQRKRANGMSDPRAFGSAYRRQRCR